MENKISQERINKIKLNIIKKINEYAQGRESDIKRGAETPKLAALLVEKYVWGAHETLNQMEEIGLKSISEEILKEGDSLCYSMDPDFDNHRKMRWAARPADLNFISE